MAIAAPVATSAPAATWSEGHVLGGNHVRSGVSGTGVGRHRQIGSSRFNGIFMAPDPTAGRRRIDAGARALQR